MNDRLDLTPEQLAIAQKLVLAPEIWKSRMGTRLSWFMTCIDQALTNDARREQIQLPAFPFANDLAIFSDYGGDHRESPVLTYSFLVVDFGALSEFEETMKQIRHEHGLGHREISFKELNSTAIRAAVPRIMRAADRLPGLLFTLVVSKKYKTILGNDQALVVARSQLDAAGIHSWKHSKELEGVLRKVHTVAYWLSMLARDGMGVFWMTDNDNIVANEACVNDLRALLAGTLGTIGAPHFRLVGFAKQFPRADGQPYLNDAVAIADLTAGAIAASYTEMRLRDVHNSKKTPAIADVLTLHAHQGVFLKKLTVAIDCDADGTQQANTFWIEETKRSRDGYLSYVSEVPCKKENLD
jgi:hypothetical protein